MHQEIARTLSEFVGHSDSSDLFWGSSLFRGQPVQGNLLPNVARNRPDRDTTEWEIAIIERLRLEAVSLIPPSVNTQLDYIALGQHYGLKTRLLDWTTNPLVAAWFACASEQEGDVYVYGLDINGMKHAPTGLNEVFMESEVRLFQPKHFDPRITAQQGWFTVHPYSAASKAFVPLELDPHFSRNLVEFTIPGSRRAEFLNSLQRHGVGFGSLFPGLEGLCRSFNER